MQEIRNFNDLMGNSKTIAIKNLLIKVLNQKFLTYDDLISRIGHNLITDNDVNYFAKLISDLYEAGYMQCMNDYKSQLEALGIKINLVKKNLVDNQKS